MDPIENPQPPAEAPRAATHGLPKRLRGTAVAQDEVPPTAAGRTRPERLETALAHARQCARIAEDNRARDILLLDVRNATPLVDYFVLASAGSRRQANAIAIEIDMAMKRLGERKLGIEGTEEGRWILVDYGDFVVHLFSEDARAYYALEDIWGDAPQVDWADPDRPRPAPRPSAPEAEPEVRDESPSEY
jgi:ribosome-associated protein